MIRNVALSLIGLMLCCVFAGGCSTAPRGEGAQQDLIVAADGTLNRFRASDPSLADRINEAYGMAVFPTVGKGGAGIGGAFGRGVVYQNGRVVGFTSVTQASIGFQLGGQAYSELLLFDQPAFDRFRGGKFDLGADASAVAVTAGAGASAVARNGVMVFTMGQKGLMYEASVSGQKFSFEPL